MRDEGEGFLCCACISSADRGRALTGVERCEMEPRSMPDANIASAADLQLIRLLYGLSEPEKSRLQGYLVVQNFPAGATVLHEHETGNAMFFVVEGAATIRRGELDLGRWERGDHFGELAMLCGRPRAASVVALTDLRVLRLDADAWERLCAVDAELTTHLLLRILEHVGVQLTSMTDVVGNLLRQRSLPRHATVRVQCQGQERILPTGVQPRDVLPTRIDDSPVVAALLDGQIRPTDTPITTDTVLCPLLASHWEGERIYRRSAALLLLEAAAEIVPEYVVTLTASIGRLQWIEVASLSGEEANLASLAARLEARMREMSAENRPFRHEWWTVAEAAHYFEERGWASTALFLRSWRDAAVPLVSCGRLYALAVGTLVSSAELVDNFSVQAADGHLLLVTQGDGEQHGALSSPLYAEMMRDHERWLRSQGVHGVGDLNALCVAGQVSGTIRVAEGFHEKRLGHLADTLAARPEVRIVCIAGPSSSGKTTFIKRLRVQLQVNGLHPVPVSLDDYYLDRDRTPRDEHGEYDYEAVDTLDLDLLHRHLARLLQGERVRTARYDFVHGVSAPEGGDELELGPNRLLMLEGIHGLNPVLLGNDIDPRHVFRIYVQPMTSLSFDRLSRVNPSDLRLLRRIVRDRHSRNCDAAANIARWPSVRRGERRYIFPYIPQADAVFDSSLIYELCVLKVYAERYLLEVSREHPSFGTALRLRQLIDRFVAIYPDHVPPTSMLREFIGASSFEY